MDCREFIQQYWRQYLMIESEFILTDSYVSIHKDNLMTFSATYNKLLLQIGSEVDIAAKQLCKLYDPRFNKRSIDQYRQCILANSTDFTTTTVEDVSHNLTLTPWREWNAHKPHWWVAYNANKHNRTETEDIGGVKKPNYQFANLQYTFEALAGLYQVYVNCYYILAKREGEETRLLPLPGSRLFVLTGGVWDSLHFYKDETQEALYAIAELLISQ